MSYLSAQEIADKQISGVSNNVDSYRKGVRATKKNPMQLAVAALPKMKANFNKAIDDGRVKEGFESVSMGEWQDKTAGIGADRIASGVEAARQTIVEFHTQLKSHQDNILRELESMPAVTKEDSRKRMLHNFDRMGTMRFIKRPRR